MSANQIGKLAKEQLTSALHEAVTESNDDCGTTETPGSDSETVMIEAIDKLWKPRNWRS